VLFISRSVRARGWALSINIDRAHFQKPNN
jgi:hypothetical protein